MCLNFLNEESRQLISNIYENALHHPSYLSYDIKYNETSYWNAGAIAIEIYKNGQFCNMFLFFPAPDRSGNIGSVAIYGINLEGHKRAIERSHLLFGLPVDYVEVDSGFETYLDVVLDSEKMAEFMKATFGEK